MKKHILLLMISLFAFSLNAQIKVEYSVGYGSYEMNDMKTQLNNLQNNLKVQYPFDIAIIDNFPSYITHNMGIAYQLDKHEFGANLTYLTTAGKVAYSDYSGEIMNKLTLNAYRIGMMYRYHFYQFRIHNATSLSFYAELSPGMTLTNLNTKAYLKVGDELKDMDEKYKFNSDMTGFSILPQVGVNLNLPHGVGIHVSGGYDFEMGSNNKDVKADWSGLRVGGGVSYQLPF